jgi:hypothetical protein
LNGARFRLVSAGVVSLAVAAGGCSSDSPPPAQKVDPATSAQASARYTGDIVRQLGRALAFEGADDSLVSKLLGRVGGTSSITGKSVRRAMPAPLPRPMLEPLLGTPAAKSMLRPRFLNLQTQEENFDDTAADLEALLEKRLFAAANIEAQSETEVTYLLRGDPTCRPLPSRILEGAADVVDPDCASDLMKLAVRVLVRGDGDGYRFKVTLGPDRLELSTFVIHSDMLAWEADLDQARRATDFANQALGETAEAFPLAVLKGRIKVAVNKLGDNPGATKASISFGVLEALDIQGKADEPFAFALGQGDPALAVTGDGAAKQVTVKWAVPRADVKVPWDPRDTGARNTDLHVSIGGVTGETTLAEMAQQVTLRGYGFAPSFVAVRGMHIADMSFNPSTGNKADVSIEMLPDDQARFQISPRLDASLAFKFAAIASELDEMPPEFLMNETYTLLLDGASPAVVETVAEKTTATGSFAGGFKVVAGMLKLSTSSSAAATVAVPAGQCLTSNEMPPQGAHPLLGSLQAAACP